VTGPDDASAQDVISEPTPTPTTQPTPHPTATPAINAPPAPDTSGKVILVSLSRQWVYAYDNGTPVFANAVETGRPELPTPSGTFHIFRKVCSDQRWTTNSGSAGFHNPGCPEHNGDGFQEVFNSPFPQGSPYWYYPTHINYAMEFLEGGYYLHDAWWHVAFGPGSNVAHKLPNGSWETGSHGCVGMTIANAQRLYEWAPVGTPVFVRTTQ
jgi:lipoprotein-anchoring transpeptidase ErfK/SrfK